jgi:Ca2+-binding RTX toxin-like protein
MVGGAGNDTYVVDNTADVTTENLNEGTDLAQASVSYTLAANVENLTLTGTTAINGAGNALNNRLTGNSGNNILDGGVGADTLVGGTGNDTYYVDNLGDVTTEAASGGTDTVIASIDWTLATNLENLTLSGTANINATGNAVANVLTGNAGNNVLNGGAGADTMVGGAGDDTYVVGSTTDVVTEGVGAGTDLVQSSVTYTLATNVENITLIDTTAINATGNALDNILTGNSGNNVLTGGSGNDTYVVTTGDTTTEAANAGTDTVQSAVTWTLATNLENLTLTGTAAANGTGNTVNNILLGNAGANVLTGNAGNDTLNGGAGADSLVGDVGNDTYWLGRDYGIDTITENDTTSGNTDMARFETGIDTDQLWFTKVGNNLDVSIIGTSDKFTLANWYLGNQYHVEQFKTSDGKTLLDSQVQNLVSAMAAFSPPTAGQTTLPTNYASSLSPVIAANWQ